MAAQTENRGFARFKRLLLANAVPLIFIILSVGGIPLSGFSGNYLVQEMLTRLARNSFLVLSLLIPIMAGMGLNFGMVLGAMAGQIGLIFITATTINHFLPSRTNIISRETLTICI